MGVHVYALDLVLSAPALAFGIRAYLDLSHKVLALALTFARVSSQTVYAGRHARRRARGTCAYAYSSCSTPDA